MRYNSNPSLLVCEYVPVWFSVVTIATFLWIKLPPHILTTDAIMSVHISLLQDIQNLYMKLHKWDRFIDKKPFKHTLGHAHMVYTHSM